MGQRVLERVCQLGEEAHLVKKFGGLQVHKAAPKRFLGQIGDGLQRRKRDIGADDRSGLQEALLLGGQVVDAG
jgi:hypothetical protein